MSEGQHARVVTDLVIAVASELFEQAEAYWRSARVLQKADLQSEFSFLPVFKLYSHAIDLYLKTFLHIHGHPVVELDSKFKNNFRRMKKRAGIYGLRFVGPDKAVMEYYTQTPVAVRLKYSATPYYAPPTAEELDGLCRTLREHVGGEVGKIV